VECFGNFKQKLAGEVAVKVQIKLRAVATYSKVVEMTEEEFAEWNERADADEGEAADGLDDEYSMYRDTPDFGDMELDTFEKVSI
jgi:hypothetical protein